MLDEILVASLHAGAPAATAALHAVGGDGCALHVAGVAESDGDLLVGDEILENDFRSLVFDTSAALISVKFFHFFEFFDDDAAQFFLRAGERFLAFNAAANFF